jgi:hypothetical protein
MTNVPDEDDAPELPAAEYLRDLANRLMHVPVEYGTDGYDIDRLAEIAREIEEKA